MSPSRLLRGAWSFAAPCCDLAGFFLGICVIIGSFSSGRGSAHLSWLLLSSALSLAARDQWLWTHPPVVRLGQTVFSLLNEAFPLSIYPVWPCSLLSLCLRSLPPESVHQFCSLYIFFPPISADTEASCSAVDAMQPQLLLFLSTYSKYTKWA